MLTVPIDHLAREIGKFDRVGIDQRRAACAPPRASAAGGRNTQPAHPDDQNCVCLLSQLVLTPGP